MPDDHSPPLDAAAHPAPGPPPRGLRSRASSQGVLTGVIVAVAAIATLYFGKDVLIPITLATLLGFVLSPLMEFLRRLWLGRVASALLAVVLAIAIIIGLGTVIGTEIAGLVGRVPQYRTTIDAKVSSLQKFVVGDIKGLSSVVAKIESLGAGTPQPKQTGAASSVPKQPQPIPVRITRSPTSSALSLGQQILTPILSPIVTLGIILLVTTFILLQKHDVRDRVIRLFAAGDLNRATVALNDAARLLSHYFLGKLAINCAFGVIVGAGLVAIGVPSPVLWGILGALLRFVPYFGSYLAAILPFLLAAAVGHGWAMALWTAALFIVTEMILGNAVEPMVFGHTTGLSPLAVIIAAIFWAWLWGIVGLILSTPLTLCLVVLGRHVQQLAFLDVLLGDRPALTPVENFYQRILAGDPDEAADFAERFLEEHSLSEYYDKVALEALQLATADANKGMLAPDQVERIKNSVNEVIDDLAEQKDIAPSGARQNESVFNRALGYVGIGESGAARSAAAATTAVGPEWREGTPVLCVAGRGPLDDVVGSMFVQLLAKHGIGSRLVTHDTVSRANIPALDAAGVRMMCILYLDITGIPAHLRFVVRRLKERIPAAPILVGLWPQRDAFFKDERAQKALGADYYVGSLRQALATCRLVAREGHDGVAPAAAFFPTDAT
ncbi:MAG: AI-2E family transporter [Acetobacteraceae bacterium]